MLPQVLKTGENNYTVYIVLERIREQACINSMQFGYIPGKGTTKIHVILTQKKASVLYLCGFIEGTWSCAMEN